MALLVMFNNFFHDLATGLWFSSMLITLLFKRWADGEKSDVVTTFFYRRLPEVLRINMISLFFVFGFGVIRALAYYDYEYVSAAGRGQITALVVKHGFLIIAAGLGVYWQREMRVALRIWQTCQAGGGDGDEDSISNP